MRILITGATGFIGRHLVERLAPEHEIIAMVRRQPTVRHPSVQYIEQDLAVPLDESRLPQALDVVIHQAALIDTERANPHDPFCVNVAATWQLLTYAAKAGIRSFVYASTGGVYGCRKDPLREGDPLNPLDLYSLTKAQAEFAVHAATGNFHKIILRYFFPYGVGTPNPIPTFVQRAVAGEVIDRLEGGGPRFNPLHISDAVEATVRALSLTGDHTINIAGTEITTFAELAALAARYAKRPVHFRPIPMAAAIPYYRSDLVAATERMEKLLDFRPQVALATGIRELVDQSTTG